MPVARRGSWLGCGRVESSGGHAGRSCGGPTFCDGVRLAGVALCEGLCDLRDLWGRAWREWFPAVVRSGEWLSPWAALLFARAL